MKVTAIEEQQKSKDRANIYLDGKFAFGLKLDLLWEHHLKVGAELTEEEIAAMKRDDALARGYDKALSYLGPRPRATQEMRQHLRDKLIFHHPDYAALDTVQQEQFREEQGAAIEHILQLLQERGHLNDVTFAKWWIQNRQTFQPRGKRLMLLELKAKGVSNQDLQEALTTPNEEGHFHSEATEQLDEVGMAYQLASKYLAKHPSLTEADYHTKVTRYLASKGFEWDTISRALNQLKTPA